VDKVSVAINFPPASRVEIGIISDTHGLVRPEVYKAFEGVDLILHAGDIGSHDVILELDPIAPVRAVVGNVDTDLLHRFEEKIVFQLVNRTIHLQHIPYDIPETNEPTDSAIREIYIFGHSHQPMNNQVGSALYFNPGSAGPRRFKLPITVGRITLDESNVTGKIISLES
jgi:putative phosphoesterase